ncbi:MAG: hypothetical protein ABJN36_16460 [Cyclobacteriaceae bacterium]
MIAPKDDSIFVCDPHTKFKLKKNPYSSSELFYKSLKEKTSTNKVTSKVSDLFLVSPNKQTLENAKAGISSDVAFQRFEGKTIRSIRIKHVDMFEGSVQDTSRFSSSKISVLANKYHFNTREWVLRSNMNLKVGQEIDAYILADNERLLRRLLYVEDAKIYVKEDGSDADVIVVIKDRLSWGFQTSYDDLNQFSFELFNRSVAGIGRYGSVGYYYNNHSSPIHGYSVRFGGQNTLKSITSWEFSHSNYWDKKDVGLNVQKEFVTPQVKYGGGLEVRSISDSTIILDGDTESDRFYKLNYRDFWVGRSFLIKKNQERRNIVISARILDHHFDNQPAVARDSNEIYYNRQFILGQVSYSKQKFIKSNYVLGFGISEDIPVGYRASLLYGKDFNQFYQQNYFGVQYFWSRYIKNKGYFLISTQLGGFAKDVIKTGVFGAGVSYYTPILHFGALDRYKSRTYLSAAYINGIRQPPARYLSLEGKIRDINGNGITGDKTKYIKIESVIFTPWYLYGFRFAPFVYGSLSKIQDNREFPTEPIIDNNFTSFGFGFRLKNESLVFNTFEIRGTRFVYAPMSTDDFVISISVSSPITFDNIFKYKPKLIPFE